MENGFSKTKGGAGEPETLNEIAMELDSLHFNAVLITDLLSVLWTASGSDASDIQEKLSSALTITISRADELSCGIERVWNSVRKTAGMERGAA